jgi:hypothetical protein
MKPFCLHVFISSGCSALKRISFVLVEFFWSVSDDLLDTNEVRLSYSIRF